MTGTNHVLTGTAIAIAIKQPLLAAPLAFASHFVLDVIPHFGEHPAYQFGHKFFMRIMVTDGIFAILSVLFVMFLAPQDAGVIALCAASAMIPDATLIYYYTQGRPNWLIFRFHLGIQWFERVPGAFVEISYFIFICTVIMALVAK